MNRGLEPEDLEKLLTAVDKLHTTASRMVKRPPRSITIELKASSISAWICVVCTIIVILSTLEILGHA